jgi:hypothetical protein
MKQKEKKENDKKEKEAREKEKKERERAEKEQKKKDQKKQSKNEASKLEIRTKQPQEDQTSEKQLTKENEFLREQALIRLKPTGRLNINTTSGVASQQIEASKLTEDKQISLPKNSATHVSSNQVQKVNVEKEVEAGRSIRRVSRPKSFVGEESKGHQRVVQRERSHPHGRKGEELMKRVSVCHISCSLQLYVRSLIIRMSLESCLSHLSQTCPTSKYSPVSVYIA